MDSDRWKQVDNLLLAVLDRPPAERDAFLRQASGGDEALEHEVRSLLTSDRQAGSFLEAPAMEVAAKASRQSEESTVVQTGLSGQTISHYKIQEMLGAGGMGVVYKAFDTKLNRLVALKFLSPHLRHQDELKQRLTAEARAASALDHPNIVVIHEIGESPDGDLFIAMAYQEGATLRTKIDAGMPVTDALQIARQVASGLARAHEHGIFHRDIKPSNIIVAKDGTARIIDFGLAKSSDATVTMDGSTKGTPLYMSPEQASGKATDFRTDLWSLGVVLYEMLAGKAPFRGDSQLSVMRAIVQDAPAKLREMRPDTPIEVEAIVTKALEKDPTRRYQSASDMVSDLSAALGTPNSLTPRPRNWNKWKVMVPAIAALVASFGAAYYYSHRPQKLTDKDTIILADFKNTTGDPVFDGALRQGLSSQLQESPFLNLVSDERIQKTLLLMDKSAEARLTPELAREICERTAAAAILEGSITRLGSQYVLGLRAKNCRTGDILDEEQVQAAKKEDVLNALSQIATKFRTRVGESLATVEKHSTPLVEATTPSLQALKAYSMAWKVMSSTGSASTVPLLKRAIEIDPKFALAYAFLGRMYGDIGASELSAESTSKAFQLRNRASDAEKFNIAASYDLQVTGNLEKARETCELWAQTYPRDVQVHAYLAGIVYRVTGNYEKSVEEARRVIKLDPYFAIGYRLLAVNYVYLDRLSEATSAIQRASEHKLDIPQFILTRYDIAFLRDEKKAMEQEAALGKRKIGAEARIISREASVQGYSGHLQQARMMSRRASDLAQRANQRENAALYETCAALREAFFGNASTSRRNAILGLDLSKDREVMYGAAFALAMSGEIHRSQTLANDLEMRFAEDTSVRYSYLPAIRALLALNNEQPAKAIELLQIAVPLELGAPRSSIHGNFGALYPIYVRGLAYLAAHQGAEAAVEFQKILDHRGIVVSDAIGVLAHLQLGRALVISGDQTKAMAAYQDFLTLWKDADADIPILKQAKAEFAKISRDKQIHGF